MLCQKHTNTHTQRNNSKKKELKLNFYCFISKQEQGKMFINCV